MFSRVPNQNETALNERRAKGRRRKWGEEERKARAESARVRRELSEDCPDRV